MIRTIVVAMLAAALALTGCGSDSEPARQAPVAASSPRTPTSAPKVDLATSCTLTLPHLATAQEIVTAFVQDADDYSTTVRKTDDILTELRYDLSIAPPSVEPWLRQQVDALAQMRDVLERGAGDTVEFQTYRSAALQLLEVCSSYGDALPSGDKS